MRSDSGQSRDRSRRRAFSLAELMIAIVILGIGLLVVASMFPVAWFKAREQVESTNIANAVVSAETVLKMKLAVAKYDPQLEADNPWIPPAPPPVHLWFVPGRTAFLGDLGIREFLTAPGGSDTRVHPINVYNMVIDAAAYQADSGTVSHAPPLDNHAAAFVPEDVHRVEMPHDPNRPPPPGPQVLFEDRVLPPLARRPPPGEFEALAEWDAKFRTRRYCWAVLAKLNNGDEWFSAHVHEGIAYVADTGNVNEPPVLKRETWDDPHVFTTYYVTLRRPQATHRFPQQDYRTPGDDWPPVIPDGTVAEPKALPAGFDTVFPTPWRVQVYVPYPSPSATGVPSEIWVNESQNVGTGPIVTGMLPRGAYMIDELTGNVYTVVRRRLLNNDQSAILTLDKEITEADITPFGGVYEQNRDRLRVVWVFPPPVDVARNANGDPLFSGSQPVVGIEVRPLVISP